MDIGKTETARSGKAAQLDRDRITRYYFILCIPVMMTHFINTDIFCTDRIAWSEAFQTFVVRYIGTSSVAGFFLISGFLFFRHFTVGQLPEKWKRRLCTLLVPYLVWNLIYGLYTFGMANVPFLNRYADFRTFSAGQLLMGIIDCDVCNPVFWYMKYLMVFVILAPVLYYALKHLWLGTAAILLIILYNAGAFGFAFPDIVHLMTFWLTYFMMGAFYGLNYDVPLFERIRKVPLWTKTAISVVLYAFSLFMFLKTESSVIHLLYNFSIAFFFWNLAGVLRFGIRPLMKCTFFMYAAHWLIARNVNKLACLLFSTDGVVGLITYMLLLPITFFVTWLIRKLLSNKGKRLWALLSGNRG